MEESTVSLKREKKNQLAVPVNSKQRKVTFNVEKKETVE